MIYYLGDGFAVEGDRAGDRRFRVLAGEFGLEGEQHAAVLAVGLRHADGFEAVGAPGFEADVAPDAGGDEARTPVPAELALLFAEHLAAADGVVELARVVVGPVRADVFQRAVEADGDLVVAGVQQRADGPAPADEHVLRAGDDAAVDPHRGDGVETVGDQVEVVLGQHPRRDAEGGAVFPVALLDPLHFQLVGSPERVGDQLVAAQVGVDAARHGGGAPGRILGRVTELPGKRGEGESGVHAWG